MSHGQPPYIQTIIPCECGSTEPYWHGPHDGERTYCCDACWEARKVTCDECGARIPEVAGGTLENRHHLDSCSLFDATKE